MGFCNESENGMKGIKIEEKPIEPNVNHPQKSLLFPIFYFTEKYKKTK